MVTRQGSTHKQPLPLYAREKRHAAVDVGFSAAVAASAAIVAFFYSHFTHFQWLFES